MQSPKQEKLQQNLLSELRRRPFALAPMAGITDHAFRSFMKKNGAGIVVTELVSATGLEYKSKKTQALMSFDEDQRPVGIQLFGDNPEHLAHAAKLVEEVGADFVDLNFGCPVPKVVKKGAGSAMMKDLPAMKKVLQSVVRAVEIPVTIKIRTGWDQSSRNALDVCRLALDEGVTWVAIHGRTRAQGYSGLADWDFIGDIKAKTQIPVIGNGDIHTGHQAVSRLKDYGCDGVMIGRGCLKNPLIFQEAQNLLEKNNIHVEKDYVRLFSGLKQELVSRCDDHITQIQLKKFAAWFASGFPGAAQFRKNIFQSKTTDEILLTANNFFETVKISHQEDTSGEGFLLGGHG
ncbi:MAG: tRNA-dihydrouridine synthase [Oligoflexia bacterium]|nr:MAG: tRNA-dihydrouridine synthase [Oligoflexia bacterium]